MQVLATSDWYVSCAKESKTLCREILRCTDSRKS